uniref:Beta-catenin-like protein 1 n=1 Tax=Trichobilharzia regenti TaxID=157069 RepID=A0AA85J030_TRIRE|nr:unnamed protein product [Trichobilharzia regenti]
MVLHYRKTKSPSPQLRRSLKPPPPPSFQDEVEPKRPKTSVDNSSTSFSETSSNAGDLEDATLPLSVSDSLDLEISNEPTTVGANEVTETTVRRLTVLLEKRALTNQEARTKFPDQPKRFMQSEVELQETLEEMQILAANPELYPILAEQTRPVSLLLGLLSHENTDISLSVIDLLHELLEPTCLKEAGLGKVNTFLEVLFSGQLIQSLIQNITRLDETKKDEADGVHKTLGIIESLLEIRPDMNVIMANQGLFAWLLRRLQRRPIFDKNKLYVSELLSILLQMDEANRRQLGEVDGIDILLQQLSVYKRHDPNSREEIELMLNLFDCLCSSLMLTENKDRFLKGEGIQLMNLMLREKHMSRDSALRVLDYALCPVSPTASQTSSELELPQKPHSSVDPEAVVVANCSKFVEILGLRTIFPLFMHTPREHALRSTSSKSKTKPKVISGPTSAEMEEHVINIVSALLRHCPEAFKSRVLAKFVENDHEKVDRLIELHLKYIDIVKETDNKVEAMRKNYKRWIGYTADEIETELMLKRLEGGLLPLQVLDVIILDVCVNGASTVLERVLHLLRMRSISMNSILNTVQEYLDNLGDESTGTSLSDKTRVTGLLQNFKEMLR